MGVDWAYPAKRWVFSGPTSYAMESSGWYWKKKGETLWDLVTNCGKGVQESKQNLAWFETTGPVKSSVERWRCWCPMSRSGSRKLRRKRSCRKYEHNQLQGNFSTKSINFLCSYSLKNKHNFLQLFPKRIFKSFQISNLATIFINIICNRMILILKLIWSE